MNEPSQTPPQNVAVIVLAAGRGTRAGQGLPKTYRQIDNTPIINYSLQRFQNIDEIKFIQPVIHPDDASLFDDALYKLSTDKLLPPVFGGATRHASVKNGLSALKKHQPDFVFIHDGARPFLSDELIARLMSALSQFDGVIPALTTPNAVWQIENNCLRHAIDRDKIVLAQTPQAFAFAPYVEAAFHCTFDPKDDAEAAVASGMRVGFVQGEPENMKLTYPEDFSND